MPEKLKKGKLIWVTKAILMELQEYVTLHVKTFLYSLHIWDMG